MKSILATLSVLVLVDTAVAAPILAEPRAYIAASAYEIGRGLWSYRDAAYAAQSGSVVRYKRTAVAVVKTDSVYMGSMTETPMYIAKDSLHGFAVGNDAVCMIDWSVHPGKLGRCAPIRGFGHGSFTGGLALGRYLAVCSPSGKANSFDTDGDSLLLLDSMTLGSTGSLRCEIEGELLHTVTQSGAGYLHQRWMVNRFGPLEARVDSFSSESFFWVAGQGAGLLGLDSTGAFARLQWGSMVHGKAIASMARLRDRYKTSSRSDSNIVVTSDSTLYLVRWTNSGESVLAAALTFEADLYGSPAVSVDGGYVWVRTPSGLLSLLIGEQVSGIATGEPRRIASLFSNVSVRNGAIAFDPSKTGAVQILSPNGGLLAELELHAGVSVSWRTSRTGLHLIRLADRTISVLIP